MAKRRKEQRFRFSFGKNWQAFLTSLQPEQIREAEKYLKTLLDIESLQDRSFLDIGSGSGLFSLAARKLGAEVHSFDYDTDSVSCTKAIKHRFFPDDRKWVVDSGSVLDSNYMRALNRFDVVYAWGVLHHTGNLKLALTNTTETVLPGGRLILAIYNDQGKKSILWWHIKRIYNRLPPPFRVFILGPLFVRLWGPTFLKDAVKGDVARTWRSYGGNRGMSPWRDVVDWVGGYPFEVAKREDIIHFYETRSFRLLRLNSAGDGLGCNEFVFEKN